MWLCLEIGVCRGPPHPPLLHTFVAGPLLQTLVAGLCVEYFSLSQGGFAARPPDSATRLVAKRPPGPVTSPMFLRRCHIHIYIYTCVLLYNVRNYLDFYIHIQDDVGALPPWVRQPEATASRKHTPHHPAQVLQNLSGPRPSGSKVPKYL